MKWIPTHERLPGAGSVVLVHTSGAMHVATFVPGRENPGDCVRFADKFGNNKVPYRWRGDGPCSWFGQEVSHWCEIEAPSL